MGAMLAQAIPRAQAPGERLRSGFDPLGNFAVSLGASKAARGDKPARGVLDAKPRRGGAAAAMGIVHALTVFGGRRIGCVRLLRNNYDNAAQSG